jgi:hypothetical protein
MMKWVMFFNYVEVSQLALVIFVVTFIWHGFELLYSFLEGRDTISYTSSGKLHIIIFSQRPGGTILYTASSEKELINLKVYFFY